MANQYIFFDEALSERFTAEEIHALVSAIAENVLDPSMAPLCQRPVLV